MKLAISGKGGVGKTTFAALLIKTLSDEGKRVLAIDADPDANLAAALGIPDPHSVVPISEMKELIGERTGTSPGSMGGFFKLNPKVDDLPEKLSVERRGRLHLSRKHAAEDAGCPCAFGPR